MRVVIEPSVPTNDGSQKHRMPNGRTEPRSAILNLVALNFGERVVFCRIGGTATMAVD